MTRIGAVAAGLLTAALVAVVALVVVGGASLVTTRGISMQPELHEGDLVLTLPASQYGEGDVAAYRSDQMQTVVLHRIVSVRDGRYTFQGDNNSWLDPETPTAEQLIGRLWLHIPQGGVWLERLTSPLALGMLAFGVVVSGGTVAGTRRTRRSRRRARRKMSQHASRPTSTRSRGALPPQLVTAAAGAAVLAVLGIALGLFAWTAPTTRVASVEETSDRTATFSYSTQVPASAAYDGTTVTSPAPVFRALAQTVDVHYSYSGRAGSVAVDAELSTPTGWRSTVALSERADFTESGYDGVVTLDLPALEQRARDAAEVIGAPVGGLTVTVRPEFVAADGAVFAPELALSLDQVSLALVGDVSSLTVADPATVVEETEQAATLGMLGREMGVETARVISLVLVLVAIAAGAVLGVLARVLSYGSEGAAIRRRYSSLLVRVQPMPTPPGRPVVDVTDFATLAKLAERYGLLVLHWSRSGLETFVVQDEGTTYRYRSPNGGHEPSRASRTPQDPLSGAVSPDTLGVSGQNVPLSR